MQKNNAMAMKQPILLDTFLLLVLIRTVANQKNLKSQIANNPAQSTMPAMRIEHVALQVADPAEMGEWYETHLKFTCKRGADEPVPVRFIADQTGKIMLEIYNNSRMKTPDYRNLDPLLFHIAFVCEEDVSDTVDRLVEAGATLYSEPEITPAGDVVAMLRDPWGVPIQLCRRATPMV
jgi:glyoxylase I family protein